MTKQHTFALLALSYLVASADGVAQHHSAGTSMNDEALINTAMLAAPLAVVDTATIIAAGSDGKMRTLRKGTNNSPVCPTTRRRRVSTRCEWTRTPLIGPRLGWSGATRPPGKVGFMYMLAGGTDASNTDPYAQKPEPGNNWIETGPQVMIVGAKGPMDGYPRDTKPNTPQPYVMWPNTPYEHLMIPVQSFLPFRASK